MIETSCVGGCICVGCSENKNKTIFCEHHDVIPQQKLNLPSSTCLENQATRHTKYVRFYIRVLYVLFIPLFLPLSLPLPYDQFNAISRIDISCLVSDLSTLKIERLSFVSILQKYQFLVPSAMSRENPENAFRDASLLVFKKRQWL